MPPDRFLLHWHPLKVIFHAPVETRGLTLADLDALKANVYRIMDAALQEYITARS